MDVLNGTDLCTLNGDFYKWNLPCREKAPGSWKWPDIWSVFMHAQSCPTLCDLMDCSLPGYSVCGILQARILKWVVVPSSRGSFWPRDPTHIPYISCISGGLVTKSCLPHVTPLTVACQSPLSVGSSRQEYWSGFPFPSPGVFLTQGLNPGLLYCRQILYQLSYKGSPPALVGRFFITSATWEALQVDI